MFSVRLGNDHYQGNDFAVAVFTLAMPLDYTHISDVPTCVVPRTYSSYGDKSFAAKQEDDIGEYSDNVSAVLSCCTADQTTVT